ncbi:MAG: hypothetical protein L0206_23850 [Actinobacteria bacterium]|nr:hypothetical protein [Actinomycetota bacterium]
MQRDPSNPPGDRARRRSLFSGRTEPPAPAMPSLTPSAAERVEAVITASQEMIQEQLDEGLRAIQHTANTLMHEIAAEVWRGAGGDKDKVGSTILHELSRDQAIRALISHSDERFQALAARTGRLEDTMNMLAESIRAAREQLERRADTLAESSPLGVGQLRDQLDEMTRQATATYQALAERDQVIAEAVHERIREHGELIARETARISAAMESYVQQGVVAMGNLAGETDSEIKTISERQQELMVRLEQTIDGRVGQLGEQVRSATDQAQQIGEQVRTVSEHAQQLADRLEHGIADRMGGLEQTVAERTDRLEQSLTERVGGLEQNVDGRMADLGEQMRSVADREQELSERLERTVDEHMAQLGEQMQLLYDRAAIATSSLQELVSGLGDRVGADTHAAVAGLMTTIQERVTGLAQLVRSDSEALRGEFVRRTAVLDEQLGARLDQDLGRVMDQTTTVIDRNMIRMFDALQGHFEQLGTSVGDRAAGAAELAIGARFDDVLARLHAASEVIERGGSQARATLDEGFSAVDERLASFGERIAAFDDWFTALDERATTLDQRFDGTDQRFAALAKLVRSDNERVAEQILADQEVTKQALRAMKELQASLPVEVVQMVEERFASLAESIERSNEMLAGRIDRMAETIGQRQNDDIQIVIDRMGDAMHALASLGKGNDRPHDDPRLELG